MIRHYDPSAIVPDESSLDLRHAQESSSADGVGLPVSDWAMDLLGRVAYSQKDHEDAAHRFSLPKRHRNVKILKLPTRKLLCPTEHLANAGHKSVKDFEYKIFSDKELLSLLICPGHSIHSTGLPSSFCIETWHPRECQIMWLIPAMIGRVSTD